jgi:Chaperone of endosialidase
MNHQKLVFTVMLMACRALCPTAQAVSPAPDGGYPGANTAEGTLALLHLSGGTNNTAVGWASLGFNVTGSFNTATGAGTLLLNNADNNTAAGAGALLSNSSGAFNTANGAFALLRNATGSSNTAIGDGALLSNTAGSNNAAIGNGALLNNETGNDNTAVGVNALEDFPGDFNTALGAFAGSNITTANHVICIGANGDNVSNSCFIGNIYGVTTLANDAIPVLIDSEGQLGTASSSRRYKTDIKPIDKASESSLALKPVSFRYRVHRDAMPQFGLIAEDVAEVNPDLVVRDKNGEIYTVRYDAVNAMLLNEFLKEHRKVEEEQETIVQLKSDAEKQTAKISKLEKGVSDLTAQLKEQAAQIRKVNARIEASRAASRVAVADP